MSGYDPLDAGADPFGPPAVPTLVACLHCQQVYESYQIEWRVEQDAEGGPHGFWCCPVPGCDGRGFWCDILPVDPDYRDERGCWVQEEGAWEPPADDAADGDPERPDDEESLPW